MSKEIHLICGKCGSDSCYITTEIVNHDEIKDGYTVEAYIKCDNCGCLSDHTSHNEQITECDKRYFGETSKKEIQAEYGKVKIIKQREV